MGKIDFHVHLTPPDISARWQKYAEKEPGFAQLSQSPHNRFADAGEAVSSLESNGFNKGVVFGFGFRDMGLCRYVNDYVIEAVQKYPRRLTGFMAVAPGDKDVEKEIDRCRDAGFCGVGELFPAWQGFAIDDAKETAAFAGACAERNLPVLLHINEPVGHYYPGKTDIALKQVERFIEHNPNLAIVLAHWGGGLLFYESMPELRKKFRSVYYDTAATPFLYDFRVYRAAAALDICEKILFGSDFPLLPPSRYMDGIEKSGLSAENQENILGRNAERLLKRAGSEQPLTA